MSQLTEWAQQLQDSAWATDLHESLYAFPLLEGTHLLGLAVSVGLLALIDLRLLGVVLPKTGKEALLRQLRPWVLGGFVVTFLTGVTLFASEAASMLASPAFQFKLLFIVLAGLNAAYFELKIARGWTADDTATATADRLAGGLSLLLWLLVIIAGRLIPYLPGPHGPHA